MLLAVLALAACNDRGCTCHTGHNVVQYYHAYETYHSTCVLHDKYGNCTSSIPYTTHHPARCDVSYQCDLSCKAVDTGRAEAHPEHPTLQTQVDNRSLLECSNEGNLK
jgi:hypothetical protein